MPSMKIDELDHYIRDLLQVDRFRDYCPNGLQVEGNREIRTIVSGVTASQALLDAAIEANADAVLVHHGYFWRNEDARIIGMKRNRIAALIHHGISLFAYHLPLDAHPTLGNNAQLADRLGFSVDGWFGDQNVAAKGQLDVAIPLNILSEKIGSVLGRTPMVIGQDDKVIRRIAWCSGAAQDYFSEAVSHGVDAYLTGEISEHSVHISRETGVAFISAGHHATERFGIQALGEFLQKQFDVHHQFIDIYNPV
jgi:dinuclear metal center YbgI/SA1388 family protein